MNMANISPMPGVKLATDFYAALREAVDGKKITKEEWGDENVYAYFKEGLLMLHKENGKDYQFILRDADIKGTDWKILD